jgi:hypothetical protein
MTQEDDAMNYADQAADDTRLAHEAIQRRRELACTALSLETALSYDVRAAEAATGPLAIVADARVAETRARIAALAAAMPPGPAPSTTSGTRVALTWSPRRRHAPG